MTLSHAGGRGDGRGQRQHTSLDLISILAISASIMCTVEKEDLLRRVLRNSVVVP